MTDIVDSATRSRMMSGIRSVNTKPELLVRKLLHARGFRYRLHYRKLPGRPDMVLKKYNAVIFIHGCFWHGHDCHLFKWPSTRPDFWKQKIESNRKRDKTVFVNLTHLGFRICIVWECALKGNSGHLPSLADKISDWLKGENAFIEISS